MVNCNRKVFKIKKGCQPTAHLNTEKNYASLMPYFFLNFSTRPVESTIFCLPVKNGWHSEQISSFILLTVERVINELPQTQVTSHFLYVGCIPFFISEPINLILGNKFNYEK